MGIQKVVRRDEIIDGEYIPTVGVVDKIWATDGGGDPDWRDNPGLVSPLGTKGDLIVYSTTEIALAIGGTNGWELVVDSTEPSGMKWQYKENLQKEVTAATYTILDSDDRYTIFFNRGTAITVTVDTLTQDNLEVDFYNLGAGTVTFVEGTTTLGLPDGSQLLTDKVCALIKVMSNDSMKLKGELI